MISEMKIFFPGNKKVFADYGGFTIETDQSRENGGDSSAAEPFSLFLASIGTCAGIYVLGFCQERNLDTNGLGLVLKHDWNEKAHRIEHIWMEITLPPDFPKKYRKAVIKAADLCTVKRHMFQPPEFEVDARIADA